MLHLDRCAFTVSGVNVSLREALSFAMIARLTETWEDEVLYVETAVAEAQRPEAQRPEATALSSANAHSRFKPTAPSQAEVQARFNTWRKTMNLISADELGAWLEQHGLALLDMQHYLTDLCLFEAMAEAQEALVVVEEAPRDPVATAQKTALYLLCSGQLPQVLEQVALRMRLGLQPCNKERHRAFLKRYADPKSSYGWGLRLAQGLGTSAPLVQWLAGLDAAYYLQVEDRTRPEALQKAMAMNPASFDATEWVCTRWESANQAAEALRYLEGAGARGPRRWLEALATAQQRPFWRESHAVGEAAKKYAQSRVHGLREGEVLPPQRDPEGFVVRQLVKRTPSHQGAASTLQAVQRWIVTEQLRSEALAHVSFSPWVSAAA
jgi:hypothetical protein